MILEVIFPNGSKYHYHIHGETYTECLGNAYEKITEVKDNWGAKVASETQFFILIKSMANEQDIQSAWKNEGGANEQHREEVQRRA